MGQNSITMFTNDSGSAGGPIAYVSDVFQDVSDTPTSNAGLSSTVSSNPLNNLYANDDFPRYGPKTLWIKDLVIEPNRAFWINGEPTYRIVWSEPFPSAQGYVFGNVQLIRRGDQTFVRVKNSGDGFGVGGVFAKCMFLMQGVADTVATGTVAVDGVANATVVDWSTLTSANPANTSIYGAVAHAGPNEAYGIHDFRLTANQSGLVFTIAGVVVYSENSTLTIDQFPGTTYNNKSQSVTSARTTLPLPSFGASTGGRSVVYKNAGGGYSISTLGASTIQSIATGTNGAGILNVTAGTGASFTAGNGIITFASAGASPYVGVIQSISTDALTVFPLLPYGISGPIYRYFQSGQSLAINASLNILSYTFGSTEIARTGFTTTNATNTYLDPQQNFCVWGNNIGVTVMDAAYNAVSFATAAGFLQCEGYFSAAEIEWVGMSFGVLSGTMVVNGLATYSHANIGFTGLLKKTVFTDAGPGWNNFAFFPGSSHVNVAINRINLYQRNADASASYGRLATFDTLQSFVPRANNGTFLAPGVYKRIYADQLNLVGTWTRVTGATLPGGVGYITNNTNAKLSFQYYGTHFSLIGGASLGNGSSMTVSIDGSANLGASCINMVTNLGMTFHTVSLSVLGGTNIISAIDIFRPTGEMKNIQTFAPTSPLSVNQPSSAYPAQQSFPFPGILNSELLLQTYSAMGTDNTGYTGNIVWASRFFSGDAQKYFGYSTNALRGDAVVILRSGLYYGSLFWNITSAGQDGAGIGWNWKLGDGSPLSGDGQKFLCSGFFHNSGKGGGAFIKYLRGGDILNFVTHNGTSPQGASWCSCRLGIIMEGGPQ